MWNYKYVRKRCHPKVLSSIVRPKLDNLCFMEFWNTKPDDGCVAQPKHVAFLDQHNKVLCIDWLFHWSSWIHTANSVLFKIAIVCKHLSSFILCTLCYTVEKIQLKPHNANSWIIYVYILYSYTHVLYFWQSLWTKKLT